MRPCRKAALVTMTLLRATSAHVSGYASSLASAQYVLKRVVLLAVMVEMAAKTTSAAWHGSCPPLGQRQRQGRQAAALGRAKTASGGFVKCCRLATTAAL